MASTVQIYSSAEVLGLDACGPSGPSGPSRPARPASRSAGAAASLHYVKSYGPGLDLALYIHTVVSQGAARRQLLGFRAPKTSMQSARRGLAELLRSCCGLAAEFVELRKKELITGREKPTNHAELANSAASPQRSPQRKKPIKTVTWELFYFICGVCGLSKPLMDAFSLLLNTLVFC